jgi:CheY-like chemotaxis protein
MSFKLLIVEESAESRALLDCCFRLKGYDIATACNGCEGLSMAILEKPDLIITEFSLPRMCAGEMIRQIRAEPEMTHTPILVYTSYGEEYADLAKFAGANMFFLKPFALEELTKNVALMLETSEDYGA